MSVQQYETDVLQEHIDSTPILIERLEQWSKGVHVVQEYVHGYAQVHNATSHSLEKMLKNLGEVPAFPDTSGVAGPESTATAANAAGSSGAAAAAGGSSTSSLGSVFRDLQSSTNALLQRSVATANGIKSSIVPQLDQIVVEIDKHYKTLRSQGGKGIKEIEKSREHTQRSIEQLGKVTSSFGSRQLSHHDDPYILHRRVEAAVADQVGRENTQAEAALNVQRSFASLEVHIMQTLRQALSSLANLNDEYDKSEHEINDAIFGLFKSVDLDREWSSFTKSNAQQLVPTSNYQRDPSRVSFMNKGHAATQALMSGILSRKSTVLKNWNQSYYALAPSGYLYQLKSPDASIEASPELSLFLPECQLSKSTKPGEFYFKIVGKDTQKMIGGRHKYVFKAASPNELEAWYAAIARVTGNIGADDDVDSPVDGETDAFGSAQHSPAQSQPQSPREPPTAAFANTNINDRVAAQPQGASPSQPAVGASASAPGVAGGPAYAAHRPSSQAPQQGFHSNAAASHQPAVSHQGGPLTSDSAATGSEQRLASGTAGHPWKQATQSAEAEVSNRDSYVSDNDPFKSF